MYTENFFWKVPKKSTESHQRLIKTATYGGKKNKDVKNKKIIFFVENQSKKMFSQQRFEAI